MWPFGKPGRTDARRTSEQNTKQQTGRFDYFCLVKLVVVRLFNNESDILLSFFWFHLQFYATKSQANTNLAYYVKLFKKCTMN